MVRVAHKAGENSDAEAADGSVGLAVTVAAHIRFEIVRFIIGTAHLEEVIGDDMHMFFEATRIKAMREMIVPMG